jgi:hypothetical protein
VVPSVLPIGNEGCRASLGAASCSCRRSGDNLRQDEQGFLGRDLECSDLDQRRADEGLDSGGRCIADAQPDDLWRCAVHQRQTPKIIVLGDHREAVLARIRPDLLIGRAAKATKLTWELSGN